MGRLDDVEELRQLAAFVYLGKLESHYLLLMSNSIRGTQVMEEVS